MKTEKKLTLWSNVLHYLSKTSKRKFQTRRAIVKLEFLRISSDFIQQEEILQSLDFARNSLKRGIVWIS